MDIKLFREETYPEDLLDIKASISSHKDDIICDPRSDEYLVDYLNRKRWYPEHPTGALIMKVAKVLSNHNIVAYHNTRLDGEESIRTNGLIHASDCYLNNLKTTYVKYDIPSTIVNEIIDAVVYEQEQRMNNGQSMRGRQLCYFYDFNYYKEYDMFLAFFGGEFVEFGLSSSNGQIPIKYKEAITIGRPYVIEFLIPGDWFEEGQLLSMAVHILQYWIHKYVREDSYDIRYDGRIEKEIPPNNIIEIHSVPDDLELIYSSVFDNN